MRFGTLEVERVADVEDTKIIFKQTIFKYFKNSKKDVEYNIGTTEKIKTRKSKDKEKLEERTLIFNPERCSGCVFCVYACPVNAIEFAGYDMLLAGMPLIIDHTSCCFCGICFAICPERAFEFKAERFETDFRLKGGARKLENCVGCRVCYEVCPAKSIRLSVRTIDEFHKRKPGKKGSLRIDSEKCKLCGKCTLFCNALVAVNKDVTPSNPSPFSKILLSEEKCDYCGLCERVCPNKAITVESEEKVNYNIEDVIVTNIEILGSCIECGICVKACPYEAVELKRSFIGEIRVHWKRLEKVCEWESCRLCINVCKSKAWYVEGGKLKLDSDLCRFCRACMYACPEKLIEVKLSNISVECRWEGWKRAVDRIIEEKIAEVERRIGTFESHISSAGDEIRLNTGIERDMDGNITEKIIKDLQVKNLQETQEIDRRYDERTNKRVAQLEKVLKNKIYRRLFELNPEKFFKTFDSKTYE